MVRVDRGLDMNELELKSGECESKRCKFVQEGRWIL